MNKEIRTMQAVDEIVAALKPISDKNNPSEMLYALFMVTTTLGLEYLSKDDLLSLVSNICDASVSKSD